jgi:YfiH family protein
VNLSAGLIPAFPHSPELANLSAFFTSRLAGEDGKDFRLGSPDPSQVDVVSAHWKDLISRNHWEDKRIFRPRQNHGHTVWVDSGEARAGETLRLTDTDAGVSMSRDIVLTVLGADCLTALLVDHHLGGLGAVHAGWKGTRDGILGLTIDTLIKQGWAKPETLKIAFGPCLSPEVFEIGPEVAEQLPANSVYRKGEKFRFDLPGSNRLQALERGIPETSIRWVNHCTLTESNDFYSHRREGFAAGRQAACISWK